MAWHIGGLKEAQDIEKRGKRSMAQPIPLSQVKGSSRMEGALENVLLLTIKLFWTFLDCVPYYNVVACWHQLEDVWLCRRAVLRKDALSESEHFVRPQDVEFLCICALQLANVGPTRH